MGFDSGFECPTCLATLKSSDRTKQSVCGWLHIYIYILSSTDRMFRCTTNLQCSYTRLLLQAGLETRLNLCHCPPQRKQMNFYVYIYANGYWSGQFTWRILQLFPPQLINPRSGGNIYIYIYIYIYIVAGVWINERLHERTRNESKIRKESYLQNNEEASLPSRLGL